MLKLGDRDRLLLCALLRSILTARLAQELLCPGSRTPLFPNLRRLRQRLQQLYAGGYINRRRLLATGEYYYFLTRRGASLVCAPDELGRLTGKVTSPIKEGQQQHEFELARFLLKFERDAAGLHLPFRFVREGQFVIRVSIDGRKRTLVPDGTILLRIKGRWRVYFLELDRSTERVTSPFSGKSFQEKIRRYSAFFPDCASHLDLALLGVRGFRVLTVCMTRERMANLVSLAQGLGKERMFRFVCREECVWRTVSGWGYRAGNVVSGMLR